MLKIKNIGSKLVELLIYIHIFIWILYIPISQIQLMFFNRRVVTMKHLIVAEIMIMFLMIIRFKNMKIKVGRIERNTFNLIVILCGCWIVTWFSNENVELYWRLYYVIQWITPLLVLISLKQSDININKFLKILRVIVIIHAILMICQHFSGSVIWPYDVDDEGRKIFFVSDQYYNTEKFLPRCPGLCSSGLEAGLLLIYGLILVITDNDMKKINKVLLSTLFLISIVFTGTRNIYVQLIFIVGLYIIINSNITTKKYKFILGLCVTCIAIAIYLYLFSHIGTGISTKNVFTDTLSVGIRTDNWKKLLIDIKNGNIFEIMFGKGIWQTVENDLLIDNMFIELIILSGIIGLFSYINYLLIIAKTFIKEGNQKDLLLACFIFSTFVYGFANVVGNAYFSLIIISVLIYNNNKDDDLKSTIMEEK